ncbi:MAG: hypothetical protein WCL28_01685 [bacterium]
MNARWLVHCGDEALGPWSAEQVREELRAGRIDAFDLVALEGSSKKRPLIDVDEIFASVAGKKDPAKTQSESHEKTALLPMAAGEVNNGARPIAQSKTALPSEQFLETGGKKTPSFTKPRAFEALAAPLAVQKLGVNNLGQRPGLPAKAPAVGAGAGIVRRYVLWTSEQSPQGPFTSREVLTFWYAKKLPANTIVQRAGQSKRVRIDDFARFYERAAPSGIAFVGEAQAAAGRLDVSTRRLVFAMLAGLSIVAAALIWSYSPERVLERARRLYKTTFGGAAVDPSSDAPLNRVASDQGALSQPNVDVKAQPVGRNPAPQSNTTPKKASQQMKRSPKVPPKVVRSARSARRPTPPPAPVISMRPSAAQPARPSGGGNWGLLEGSTVTLTGYRFNISALNACELKCKIPMTGPKGPITAVFFKEAFAGALARNTSAVSVTGTVRRDLTTGALSILVQSVK